MASVTFRNRDDEAKIRLRTRTSGKPFGSVELRLPLREPM